ncbi:hypothetical protein GCM10009119_10910 [Algoriphagus jejuensis]|uniref:Trypsin-like peptidase n=1 Tax=Algoriphagus jejuensis TaxID=419934 RepID=A0ABN1MYH3_9BACT
MRVLLFFMLFQVSGTLPAQTGTEMSFPYKDIVFSVTEAFGNSFGSAFIVGKNDQYFFLATAKHVVQDDRQLLLTSSEGVQYPAVLVKAHSIHDIALLQMPIFPLDLDSIPMVSNLSMNDEVTFVSVKDSGRILPSKSPGLVRDVNGESLSIIMQEVESGHSGSPLLSDQGIAGMIIRNGKFIESLNIVLVKETIEGWNKGLFRSLLSEKVQINARIALPFSNASELPIAIKEIEIDGACSDNTFNLVDRYLNTSWSCTIDSIESNRIRIGLHEPILITGFDVYVKENFRSEISAIEISVINSLGNRSILPEFLKTQGGGYWYSYILVEPINSSQLELEVIFNQLKGDVIVFNEVQIRGIAI